MEERIDRNSPNAHYQRIFGEETPTSAAQTATIILDRVKADSCRILVEPDTERLDKLVLQWSEQAYDVDFFERFAKEARWQVGP
jgi:hypothetical protein